MWCRLPVSQLATNHQASGSAFDPSGWLHAVDFMRLHLSNCQMSCPQQDTRLAGHYACICPLNVRARRGSCGPGRAGQLLLLLLLLPLLVRFAWQLNATLHASIKKDVASAFVQSGNELREMNTKASHSIPPEHGCLLKFRNNKFVYTHIYKFSLNKQDTKQNGKICCWFFFRSFKLNSRPVANNRMQDIQEMAYILFLFSK